MAEHQLARAAKRRTSSTSPGRGPDRCGERGATTFMNDRCGMMSDYLQGNDFSILLLWTMWPATTLIITAGLIAGDALISGVLVPVLAVLGVPSL